MNSFILQVKTISINREPRRVVDLGVNPAFCYVDVDEELCGKISEYHTRLVEMNISSLSAVSSSPQWRFPANRYSKPTRIANSYLNISRNYVWFSADLYEGFADFETARIPFSVFELNEQRSREAPYLETNYRVAKSEFDKLVAMNRRLEEISDYQCGLWDVGHEIGKLNQFLMEDIVGKEFTQLMQASGNAANDLQTEFEKLEERITKVEWCVSDASLGISRGRDFAALDRESRLIRIQVSDISINVAETNMYLYGKKYRNDGELGKQQAFLEVDLKPILEH